MSCLTLCNAMDYSPPGSSVHGIFPARILECVATSFSKGSNSLLHWQALGGGFFTAEPPGKVSVTCIQKYTNSAMRIKGDNYM